MLAPPAVRFCELPVQIVPPPAVTLGSALTVTEYVLNVPLAQKFVGVTFTLPEVAVVAKLTVIAFVPLPEVIDAPEGTDHV